MSIGGDDYDERGRTSGEAGASRRRGSAGDPGRGTARQGTRTRLPGEDGDVYGVGRRSAGRPGRSLITVVGVVVLLIAAIAFANRGGGDGGSGSGGDPAGDAKEDGAQPTAPTGEKPVQNQDGTTGIPSGFAQSEQGAQSAAANYAVALVSAEIVKPAARPGIVQQIFAPDAAQQMQAKLDKVYSPSSLNKLGLDKTGTAKSGQTYVSRATPIGTTVTSFDDSTAKVDVWCAGVFGTAGGDSKNPVTSDWFTMKVDLRWADGDWKIRSYTQSEGPAPVNGDNRASAADEIAKAVEQYGGFTYAR